MSVPYLRPEELARIRARLARATRWPWRTAPGKSWVVAPEVPEVIAHTAQGPYGAGSWLYYGGELVCESIGEADAEFVAHAPTDVAALLLEVGRLGQENADLRGELQAAQGWNRLRLPAPRAEVAHA